MEVEDEEEVAALEDEDLATVVGGAHVLVGGTHVRVIVVQREHGFVELEKVLVTQVVGVGQVPASAAVVVAPVVAFAREIHPLGMPELVAHEGKVALTAERSGDETHHLVERDAALDHDGWFVQSGHTRVHFRIHQPKRRRLVADDGLIVRLDVRDGLLGVTAVAQRAHHFEHAPLLIGAFFQILHPKVGDGHGQTSVETDAAFVDGQAQRGHAAHVLRDDFNFRVQRVKHLVREHQVHNTVDVRGGRKVLFVITGKFHL
mmetsp:Transcript_1953/g.7602  ORF Transcript_1953/g.7602 Transcript_1953/m.7602 type:complete len:260 (-) Transcript_1953:1246-2025(-)